MGHLFLNYLHNDSEYSMVKAQGWQMGFVFKLCEDKTDGVIMLS